MKKRLLLLAAVGSMLVLLNDCSQKLDVSAPYKNVPIVYGLLSQQDAVHYIRIQKGFLTKGNAYVSAAVTDSIYYGNTLNVTIQTLPSGPVYNLTRIDGATVGLNKDTGIFATSPNILYSFTGTLNPSNNYSLTVINSASTDTVTAQTGLVQSFNIATPVYGQIFNLNDANPSQVVWTPSSNGSIYDLDLTFNYLEYNYSTNLLQKDTSVTIVLLSEYLASSNTGGGQISVPITSDLVLYSLINAITVNTNVYRVFNMNKGMQFTFAAGGPDLSSYLTSQQAQSSSLASTEALPPYTNIKGGYGVFSSRLTQQVDSVLLSQDALDTLACSGISSSLRFLNHLGQLCNQ